MSYAYLHRSLTKGVACSFSNYGGVPLKAEYCHEAVRLLTHCILDAFLNY